MAIAPMVSPNMWYTKVIHSGLEGKNGLSNLALSPRFDVLLFINTYPPEPVIMEIFFRLIEWTERRRGGEAERGDR